MPTDIADAIKDINKRLIAAEGQIFGFTQLVHALVASNSVSAVILREHIELLRSRLVPADATDEATALYFGSPGSDERNAQSRRCANFPSHSRRPTGTMPCRDSRTPLVRFGSEGCLTPAKAENES